MSIGWAEDEERAGNEATKEPIWGNMFRGVAISVSPTESQYKLGQKIEVSAVVKNFGKEEVQLLTVGSFLENCRVALFDLDGRPVPKSESAVELEALLGQKRVVFGQKITRIKPGETATWNKLFSLNEWFKIDKEGTYLLVVMRRIWLWDKGFLISNAAKIIITNSENLSAPDQHHTPQEDNILGQDRLEAGKYVVIGGLCAILIVGCIALLKKAIIRGKSRAT